MVLLIILGGFAQTLGNASLRNAGDTATTRIRIARLKAQDEAGREPRLYGIVLLSDGRDENSKITETDMFRNCLPAPGTEDGRGVKIYTIGYGDDADKDLLLRIATRTNGKTYAATPDNIQKIYDEISAEQ